MSVPNGFDLFEHPWPPSLIQGDYTTHRRYGEFLAQAATHGFDITSEGFEDAAEGFFLFFLLGGEPTTVPNSPTSDSGNHDEAHHCEAGLRRLPRQ